MDPNEQNLQGKTPLHLSGKIYEVLTTIAQHGHHQSSLQLMKGGANPSIKDNNQNTPLMLTDRKQNDAVIAGMYGIPGILIASDELTCLQSVLRV